MYTSIEIHRRESTRGESFAGSLFVRVIHNRKSRDFTLPWKLYAEEWDHRNRRVRHDMALPGREEYLQEVEQGLVDALIFLRKESGRLRSERRLSANELIDRYKNHCSGCQLKAWSDSLVAGLKEEGRVRTAEAYESAVRRLLRFVKADDQDMNLIDADLVGRFEKAMRQEGLSDNTISFYQRMLRAIYNKAIKEGIIPKPLCCPFADAFTGVPPTPKRALTASQMQSVAEIDYKDEKLSPSLQMACALFLFGFWARGMSFVDVAYARKSDIRGGVLYYNRRKSGSRMEIPLTEEMRELIEWFAAKTKGSPYLFPLITRPGENEYLQYRSALRLQNKRLKRLAVQFSTFNFQLSTHTGRHTWATLAKQLLVPLSQISEALGHRSEKTTAIYLGSFDHSVWDEVNMKIRASIKK